MQVHPPASGGITWLPPLQVERLAGERAGAVVGVPPGTRVASSTCQAPCSEASPPPWASRSGALMGSTEGRWELLVALVLAFVQSKSGSGSGKTEDAQNGNGPGVSWVYPSMMERISLGDGFLLVIAL